jgi:hypothetical protein
MRKRLIAFSGRLYRALLMFYPRQHRREYSDSMVQVFQDVSWMTYNQHGLIGLAFWWCTTLVDLIRTVIVERRAVMMSKSKVINANVATVTSLVLCIPFLFLAVTAMFQFKPPFVAQLEPLMFDGTRPTTLGYAIMLGMLLALPLAFLINLLSMVTKVSETSEATGTGSEPEIRFQPTLAHIISGVAILCVVLATLANQVLHELRPFVNPLGSASIAGKLLFLLGLLVLPMAFLLNRLPRFRRVGATGSLIIQPTSINLIIGAGILLVLLMVASTFALETVACSVGVPNCD